MRCRGRSIGLALCCLAATAFADERILDFKSTLQVRDNADLEVREDIRVRAEGNQIRHGIYRDFPTDYIDAHGLNVHIAFHLDGIRVDGAPEDSHRERLENGIRIYIGNRNRVVPAGEHVYTLDYHVNRELGFFDDHDELYWNVNGNGWRFSIDRIEAVVTVPSGAVLQALPLAGYTGLQGARGHDFTTEKTLEGPIRFWTSRVLTPGEGLTIVVSWPKGFVKEPGSLQKCLWVLEDNQDIAAAVLGILVVVGYFSFVWWQFGKDPAPGVIIPRFIPPDNWTPGFMRFVEKEAWDDKILAATLISLAVKGYLKITQTGSQYGLVKVEGSKEPLAPEESIVYQDLLGSNSTLFFDSEDYVLFQRTRSHLEDSLRVRAEGPLFVTNIGLWGYGLLLSILSVAATAMLNPSPWAMYPLIGLLGVLNLVFLKLLPAPTSTGRHVMDAIEGFRLYLGVTEKDRLNYLNPPEKTPQLFEKFLPYALALDVEQQWGNQFASVLNRSGRGVDGAAGVYHPLWYVGSDWNSSNLSATTHALGNGFAQSISSAATPPGSSSGGGGFSGGGGGGSSGGGGGGGGGGGW